MLKKYITFINLLLIRFKGLVNKPLLTLINIGAIINIISIFIYNKFSLPYIIIFTLFSTFNNTFINIISIIEINIYIVGYYNCVIFFVVN